jgi:hypothetical protein
MLLTLALATMTSLCRPADLICPFQMPVAELAMNEVPNFLPESHECWSHGPCAEPRITREMAQAYLREISPVLTTASLPDALTRRAISEVETFHHQCNDEIRLDFARNFSAGDFEPSYRQGNAQATERFFRTAAWARLKELRSGFSPIDAAGSYQPLLTRMPQAMRLKVERFLRTAAGQWWLASRDASWRRLLASSTEVPRLCGVATARFKRQLIGLLVEHGMTEPVQYLSARQNERRSGSRENR